MRALSPGTKVRRPIDRGLMLASFGIAVGLVAIVFAFVSATDGRDVDLPDGIEAVSPPPDAPQALAQTQVIADLADGYIGEFAIDDTDFETVRLDEVGRANVEPGTQIELPPGTVYEPGNATLTFTPSDDSEIERFESGRHQVRLVYWPIEEGRSVARTFIWYFSSV